MGRSGSCTSVVVGAALCVLSACGSGGSSQPPASRVLASKTVTPAGGTVTVPGGPVVEIPPGAVAGDTEVTISRSPEAAPPGTLGTAYELGPSGRTFSPPVRVSFPVPPGTTAAAVWTKPAGAARFTSLPTEMSAGAAVAEVNHFSIFLVGPVDLAGTWTGELSWVGTTATGTPSGGQVVQARDVTQSVGEVTYTVVSSTGAHASCSGRIAGQELPATCVLSSFDGTCSATYAPTGTIQGTTWVHAATYTWTGSCPAAGQRVTVGPGTLTRRGGPPLDVSGTYDWTGDYVLSGSTTSPDHRFTATGTNVRTQAGSRVEASVSLDTQPPRTVSCRGPIVGDRIYPWCKVDQTGEEQGFVETVTPGTPLTVARSSTSSLDAGAAGGYARLTEDVREVRRTGPSLATTARPTFDPPGGAYTTVQRVTMASATPGATIRYTVDGSTPHAGSTLYTDPVTVATSTVLRAIATHQGLVDSEVVTATYVIGGSGGSAPGTPPATFSVVVRGERFTGVPEGGKVTSNPPGLDCGSLGGVTFTACQADFPVDAAVTITATHDAGYVAHQFAGSCSGSGTCSLAGNADALVVVLFTTPSTVHVDFTDPALHGPEYYKFVSGAPDAYQCTACHGASLQGSGLARSCAECHAWPR